MEYKKVSQNINNIVNDQVRKLESIFPSAVKDGEVDFEALKEELGQFEEVGGEKYELTWAGKKNAKKIAQEDVIGRTLKFIPEDSKDADTTENLYIEGENLEVLKLLRQNYYASIKMIYIDPPYNTGNDFVYMDDFKIDRQVSDLAEGDISEEGERFTVNSKSQNRFHAKWLSNFYSRIIVAKDLLKDDGVIFISIDDNEIDNVLKCCNEVFGEENFVDCIIWNKRIPKNDNKGIGNIHEYIVVYVKNCLYEQKFVMQKEGLDEIFAFLSDMKKRMVPIPEAEAELKKLYNKKVYDRGITLYNNLDDNYEPWGKINMSWPNGNTFGPAYDVIHPKTGKPTKVPDRGWRWNKTTFDSQLDYNHVIERYDGSFVCGNIWFAKDENTQPSSIKYLKDVGQMLLRSIISLKSDGGMEIEKLFNEKNYFSYPKPTSLLEILICSVDTRNEIILDFFSGSSTTAHAVMNANMHDGGHRKFIMVQYPEKCGENSEAKKNGYENLCSLGEERIRLAGDLLHSDNLQNNNVDVGFKVFRTANTNIKWNFTMDMGQVNVNQLEYTPDLVDFMPSANDIDIVYELMLRQRDVALSETLEQLSDIGSRTYFYASSYLVCLETTITEDLVSKLAKLDPMPIKFIFRDSAFKDDISLKDETFRRLKALIEKNAGTSKPTYTVEFI